MLTSEEYNIYQRIRDIWKRFGFEEMDEEYSKIDQTIGADRLNRGANFEERNAELVFRMVCDQWNVSPHEAVPLRSMEWDNLDRSQPKLNGEVDLVIVNSSQNVAMFLCEFKGSFYELSAATRQCRPKLKRSIQLRHAGSPLGKGCVKTSPDTPIILVTTIPGHPYLQGAEPKVIAEIMQWIHYRNVDLERDDVAFEVIQSIRSELDLTVSPDETLWNCWDNVFVLVE